MNAFKKSIALACAASVLSFGVALAQTAPAAPDATAPAAGDTAAPAAPAADATAPAKPMKKSSKMSHKKMAKKMGHKSMAKKKAM